MKRIIITESQAKLLKRYLNEAPEPVDTFAQEVGVEFAKSLSEAREGLKLVLFFGSENKDGSWNEDNLTVSTFSITKIDADTGEIYLKHDESKGKQTVLNSTMDEDDRFIISPSSSFVFNGGNPNIKIALEVNGKRKYAEVQQLLQVEIVRPELDIDSIIDASQEKWAAIRKDLMTKAEFEPSWFGMDNLFFYPKGFSQMDKLAKKYGAGISDESDSTEPVKFTVTYENVGSTSKVDGEVIGRILEGSRIEGIYDKKANTITYEGVEDRKFVFNINSNDVAAAGSEYFVTVDVFIGDQKVVPKQNTRIKITKFPNRK